MTKLDDNELGVGRYVALLVVDASRAFTDPDSPLGADFHREMETIIDLMDLAKGQGWPRFFSTVWYENEDEAHVFRAKLPVLNSLQAGSDNVAIDDRLSVEPNDHLFRKTHASCFFGTHLNEQLQAAGIDSLVIAGFTTSGCVRATAVDALQHDFLTTVVADAVGDRDAEAHRANLFDLRAKYTDVRTLDALKEILKG